MIPAPAASAESSAAFEADLLAIADFVSRDFGDRFLEAVTEFAARLFGVDYVHIALLEPDGTSVRVVAGYREGLPVAPGYVYALPGTPCEHVLQLDHQCYAEDVQTLFPSDHDLQDLHAEAYIGEPIIDANGHALGLMVLVSRQPKADSRILVAGMRILAARASTALQQQRSEASLRCQQEILRASELRFRSLFEQVPNIAVQGYDATRRVIYWNAASEVLYGYRVEEALGRQLEDLIIPGVMRQGVIDAVTAWVGGGPAIPAGELVLRRKDDSPVSVFSSHALLMNISGEAEMYCVDVELTELKKKEAELRDYQAHLEDMVAERTRDLQVAKEAAEAANRAKSTFLANMSHELRTPMHGIMGMINLARRRMTDAKGIDQLDKAKGSAEHLMAVINDVLDISKIEAERFSLSLAPLQLRPVLDHLVDMLGQKAAEKSLALVIDLPAELAHVELRGDAVRLGQVLINLVGNALKFTERGEIRVTIRKVSEDHTHLLVQFEVRDEGIGIDVHDQQRLFEAFEQADGSMSRRYGGTGLGLTISKRLVEMMGGTIVIVSAPGQGSTFRFTVRFAKAVAARPESPVTGKDAQQLLGRFKGAHVLLAEDEPVSLEVARNLLEEAGLRVDTAEDGVIALRMAREHCYALILMDVQMPAMNGLESVRAIRADSLNRHTPILALTANAFVEDRAASKAAGMDGHLAKPVNATDLYAAVLDWLVKGASSPTGGG